MKPPRNELHRRSIPGAARFLTFSTYRRLRLFDNERIKAHFIDRLTAAAATHNARTIAWVIMPEHVHLIVYFEPDDRTSAFLRTLKRPFARTLLDYWRSTDAPILARLRTPAGETHVWQPGGGYDRNVVGHELIEKIRYVHANPIRRGLCATSVDWRWFSASAHRNDPDAIGPPIAFDLVPDHQGELM